MLLQEAVNERNAFLRQKEILDACTRGVGSSSRERVASPGRPNFDFESESECSDDEGVDQIYLSKDFTNGWKFKKDHELSNVFDRLNLERQSLKEMPTPARESQKTNSQLSTGAMEVIREQYEPVDLASTSEDSEISPPAAKRLRADVPQQQFQQQVPFRQQQVPPQQFQQQQPQRQFVQQQVQQQRDYSNRRLEPPKVWNHQTSTGSRPRFVMPEYAQPFVQQQRSSVASAQSFHSAASTIHPQDRRQSQSNPRQSQSDQPIIQQRIPQQLRQYQQPPPQKKFTSVTAPSQAHNMLQQQQPQRSRSGSLRRMFEQNKSQARSQNNHQPRVESRQQRVAAKMPARSQNHQPRVEALSQPRVAAKMPARPPSLARAPPAKRLNPSPVQRPAPKRRPAVRNSQQPPADFVPRRSSRLSQLSNNSRSSAASVVDLISDSD